MGTAIGDHDRRARHERRRPRSSACARSRARPPRPSAHLSRLPAEARTSYTLLLNAPVHRRAGARAAAATRRSPFNVGISNVPGPTEPLYMNGSRLDSLFPLSLLMHGNALNITCVSYAGTLNFGFTGARDTMPHLQRLAIYMGEALEEIEGLLGKRGASRAGAQRRRSVIRGSAGTPCSVSATRARAAARRCARPARSARRGARRGGRGARTARRRSGSPTLLVGRPCRGRARAAAASRWAAARRPELLARAVRTSRDRGRRAGRAPSAPPPPPPGPAAAGDRVARSGAGAACRRPAARAAAWRSAWSPARRGRRAAPSSRRTAAVVAARRAVGLGRRAARRPSRCPREERGARRGRRRPGRRRRPRRPRAARTADRPEAHRAADRDVLDAHDPDVPADRREQVEEHRDRHGEGRLADGERRRARRVGGEEDRDGQRDP